MCADETLKQTEGVISYFHKYIDENFDSSIEIPKSIPSDMGIGLVSNKTSRQKEEAF
jgi:hypothetical protein